MNDKTANRVGLISIGLPYFDIQVAAMHLQVTRRFLEKNWQVSGPENVITGREMLDEAIREFFQAKKIDVLILQVGTFPDGEFPLILAEELNIPIILHSLPEPDLEHNIDLNSLSGANLSTYSLSATAHPHSFLHGDPGDKKVQQELTAHLRAGFALASLHGLRVGLVGFRAPGFYPCVFDELMLRKILGVSLDYIDLGEVKKAFNSSLRKKAPHQTFLTPDGETLPDLSIQWMEAHYAALTGVFEDSGKHVFAIRDWPELLDIYAPGSIWPALGWMLDDGYLVAPEGDVNAAVTMHLAQMLGGGVPFFSDISAWDDNLSALLLWHYGAAPSLANDPNLIRFGREGRQVEFTLKPGPATLLRLGMKDHQFRLLAVASRILDKPVTIKRAGAWLQTLNMPAGDVVYKLLDQGWEHHYCLIYGDILTELQVFSKLSGISLEVL